MTRPLAPTVLSVDASHDDQRRLRTAAGLSQAELANRMGVDRAYVSGLELGERNPTVITLWHVAQALGTKMDALRR
jgi:transcriptional regulator with XRE-family HTH domain